MRICLVVEYYYPHVGGAERLFQNLAEGFVKRGHQCHVVTTMVEGTEAEQTLGGVHIHRVRVPRGIERYAFMVAALPKAIRYARLSDVVQTTTYTAAPTAWVAARAVKRPVVLYVHEVIGRRWTSLGLNPLVAPLYRRFEDFVLALPFDAFMCNSQSTLKDAIAHGIDRQRLHFAYPGIDHNIFNPEEAAAHHQSIRRELGLDERFIYLYFGRPGPTKGVEYLVRAIPLIKERIADATALLILSKSPRSGYEQINRIIDELDIVRGRDVVVMDPVAVERLPFYIKAADCVVVPSLTEGFGSTCAEACAMQVPVVATKAGALPEVVSGRYVLVEPANPQAIAEGVERVYRREYNISEPRRFCWDDTVTAHLRLYESLIKGYGRKG